MLITEARYFPDFYSQYEYVNQLGGNKVEGIWTKRTKKQFKKRPKSVLEL